jgi:hypothetical protein
MRRFLPHPYRFIARTNISRPKAINLTAFDRKGQSSFDCLPLVLPNSALTLLIPCSLILSHSLSLSLSLSPTNPHLTHNTQSGIAAAGDTSHGNCIVQGQDPQNIEDIFKRPDEKEKLQHINIQHFNHN